MTALARKLVVVVWHLLSKQEPYRYGAWQRTRFKLKKLKATPRPGPQPAGIIGRAGET